MLKTSELGSDLLLFSVDSSPPTTSRFWWHRNLPLSLALSFRLLLYWAFLVDSWPPDLAWSEETSCWPYYCQAPFPPGSPTSVRAVANLLFTQAWKLGIIVAPSFFHSPPVKSSLSPVGSTFKTCFPVVTPHVSSLLAAPLALDCPLSTW